MRFGLSGRSKTLALATAMALGFATPASADDFIETSGRVLMIGLPVAGGAYALYKGDRQGLLQLGGSVVSAVGVSFLLKEVVKEERPDHSGWDAFPSDSTAIAFSVRVLDPGPVRMGLRAAGLCDCGLCRVFAGGGGQAPLARCGSRRGDRHGRRMAVHRSL